MQDISTYDFSGNITTIIGFIGILSTGIIMISAFTKYFNSPLRK